MASTIANYQGNGSTTDFSVPFDYLSKKFVKVTVDSREKLGGDYGDTTKDYFFVDKTTIRFNTAPASGTEIIIRRYTSATDRIVSFKDASVLKAKDLDASAIQTIHIAEEGRDIINDALIVDKEGNWDARGKRITNVGAPVADSDAVTYGAYKTDANGAYQAKIEAKKQADLAKQYADQAVAGQLQADWTQNDSTKKDFIKNKPDLSAYAKNSVVAEGTTKPRMLKDRFADVVNVKDFGAVGDGIHDDTEAIRDAFASGKNVYIPMGVYVCTGELELVTPGQKVYGAGMGMGYRFPGAWSSTHWSDVSTILMKGEGQKRLRTRIKSRQTVVELGDDPLSVAINIQAEGVVLEDFCVRLDVEVSEEALEACASWNRTPEQQALVEQERTNLGADWDVGIFSGSRTWGVYDRVAVVGYFRQAGFWMDFTQDPNLPRFNDLKGNPYPQSNVPNGNDGHNFFSCYTFGARWGLIWRGADSDDPDAHFYDDTRDYYDQLTNSTVKDHRGSFGGSDLNCFGCTFYGNSHHTQLQLYPLELKDPLADMGNGAGALFISGLAGNASGRCHGHRFIATRFAACGPWRVCLGVTGRDSFINCVIDIEQLRNIDGSSVKMDDTNNYGPFWCSPYVYDCRLFGQSGLWYRKFLDPETRDLEVLCTDQYGPKESTRLLTRRIDLGAGTVGNVDTGSSYVSLNSGYGSQCLVQFKNDGKLVGSLKHYASGTFAYCQPSDGSSLEKVAIRGGLNGTQIDFRGIANAPVDFYGNSTFGIRLLDYESHALFFRHEPDNKYMNVDGVVRPASDNAYSLGVSSSRWSQVYAATGTINTSDERSKTAIVDPEESLMRAWGKVNFKVFQFKDAFENKGEYARLHCGVIAQQVIEAFASEGLDASRYGLLCYDKWDDEYEDIEIIDQVEVADEEGNIVMPQKTHVEHRLVTPAGDRYGIRYEEALALEAAYLRWELQKIKNSLGTSSSNPEEHSSLAKIGI